MNSLTFCSRMIIITSISDKYAASAYNDMKCNNRITTCNKLIQPLYISYYPYEQTYKYVIDISSFDSVFNVCSYLNCALIYFLKYTIYTKQSWLLKELRADSYDYGGTILEIKTTDISRLKIM